MDTLLPEKLKVLWQSVEAGSHTEEDYERLKQEWFDQYKTAWSRAVLLPGMSDLKTSMLTELARYTGLADLAEIERRCRCAPADLASEWERGVKASDRASVEQVARHRSYRDAALGTIGALEDFVEEIQQHTITPLLLRRVDHAFQPRQRRHEIGQSQFERVLHADARLQVARGQPKTRRTDTASRLCENDV